MDLTRDDLPLVSVIIPAYNAETRIADTLASVIAQDYANIEIVVVNDCSTDRTAEIARDILESSGRRYKLIEHEHNRGECAARNTAIEASSGELLWCIDADDMAEKNLVSKLQRSIEIYGSDVSICGFKAIFLNIDRPDIQVPVGLKNGVYPGADIACMKILKKIRPAIWTMMFRKRLASEAGLLFTVGCIAGGDTEYQSKLFATAERISVVDEYLYIYVHHEGMVSVANTISKEREIRKYNQLIGIDIRLAEYIEKNCEDLKLLFLARSLLRPEAIIRMFTLAAKQGNRAEFDRLLKDSALMSQLVEARGLLFKKPELFFKAMMIKLFPNIFYIIRAGR